MDYLVVSEGKEHDQTFSEAFNSSYVTTGHDGSAVPPIGFSERQIIGARALREVRCGDIVNLGIGLPRRSHRSPHKPGDSGNLPSRW